MGTRFSRIWLLCAAGFTALFGGAVTLEADGAAYLAVVGPCPLRYQPPQITQPLYLPPLVMQDPAAPRIIGSYTNNITGPPEVLTAVSPDPAPPQYTPFDYSPFGGAWVNSLVGLSAYNSLLPKATEPAPIPAVVDYRSNAAPAVPTASAASSAPPMMVVTPQMLVDYFKPGRPATNSPSAGGSGPVGFTPAPPPPTSNASHRSP